PLSRIYTLSLHDALPIYLQLGGPLRGEIRVVPHHLHPEGSGELGYMPADPAESHDPHRLAAQLAALEALAVPLAAAHRLRRPGRSEEHTSELQSPDHLVC